MLKRNKLKLIISFVIILLPIVFGIITWNDLPDVMTTHWGIDGRADGFSGKAFAVFGLPIVFLILHLVCVLVTMLDKKQKEQNDKALGVVFWILPFNSLFANGTVYRSAFGKEIDFAWFVPALLGVMFIFIGNYLPKVRQNRTLGIKIFWTLNNEENWNKTHRFGGKLWVVGGLIILFSSFLPFKAAICVMACTLVAMIVIPVVYSYRIYQKHQKEGVVYAAPPRSKAQKLGIIIGVIALVVGLAVLMFTGDIDVSCGETSLVIETPFWSDSEVEYSELDSIDYRKSFDIGIRTNGFGSARLSMGIFQNDELGLYTLYAYRGAEEFVVLTSGTKTLVIGMNNTEDTRAIYDVLKDKI